MSALRIDNSTVPAECTEHLKGYLNTQEIIGEKVDCGYKATVLNVPCWLDCAVSPDSSLVIVAARPVENSSWSFGSCFPQLPGDAEDGFFRMRSLTLENSLWLFVWTRDTRPVDVKEHLSKLDLFKKWADEQRIDDVASLGFNADELQVTLPANAETDENENPVTRTSRSGLFLWGDLGLEALPWLGELKGFLGDFDVRFTKTRVEYKGGWPFLTLQWPPGGYDFGGDGLAFRNATISISSIPFIMPQDTSVGIEGDFVFSGDKSIHVELNYPIDGDYIRASGKYKGGPEHLLGDSTSLGLPGPAPAFGADDEIELELGFSKSARKLTLLKFALDLRDKEWTLLSQPVCLTLEGVSFYITIFDPLDSSRTVHADLTAEATFGDTSDGAEPVRLVCGGSYPDKALFLQARNSIPVGRLLDKLINQDGASDGLEKFTVDDLRLAYNYDSQYLSLRFNVPEKWAIVDGFEVGDVQFQIEGQGKYSGRLAAVLTIAADTAHEFDVELEAKYANGWQFSGSTSAGQEILIGELIEDLAVKFGAAKPTLPPTLAELAVKDLSVSFDTKDKDFKFSCKADMPVSASSSLDVELDIDVTHPEGVSQFELSGQVDVEVDTTTTLTFKLELEHDSKMDKLVFAYSHDGTLPLDISALLKALAPGDDDLSNLITGLDIAVDLKSIQLAFQKKVTTENTKSLFGMSLYAGMSVSGPEPVEVNSILVVSVERPTAKPEGEKAEGEIGKTSNETRILFGLKIGAELSLRDLPLVGSVLPDDMGVKVLHLFVATRPFDSDDETEIKEILPEHAIIFPSAEAEAPTAPVLATGITVSALLMMGTESRTLVLSPSSGAKPASEKKQGESTPASNEITTRTDALSHEEAQDQTQEVDTSAALTTKPSVKWIKVRKSFGPVRFEQIGFQYQDQKLWFLLDASLSLSGLTISADGLGFGTSITKLEPTFDLQGLGIRLKTSGLEISGALLKTKMMQDDKAYDEYLGSAIVRSKMFTLAAIGAYSNVGDSPSLFFFALLDKPLGGPPYLFVTGLAGGFGYNRAMRTPAISQVKNFPLIAAMADPSKIGGKDASPLKVLSSLGDWIRPQPGELWLAAGLSFQSFGIINSSVLAIAMFGQEFQVLVVGLSSVKLPQQGKVYASAELMLQITVRPAQGIISAMALLSPNSYLFDPKCQLTGGFAFILWFGDNPHAGDFVLTLGGYHPTFIAPSHYPQVPRLGINWPISDEVTIKGEAYFALTPSCVMAGGRLEVGFSSGDLKAWFKAQADMIVAWNPFYFDVTMSVWIGVSYRVKTFLTDTTVNAEVGASVELWGPPTGGRAHINWWVISFTVSFGEAKPPAPIALDWDGFKTMLPTRSNVDQAALPTTDPDLAAIQISVNGGLQQEDGEGGEKRWIIRSDEFAFSIESAIPLTEAKLAGLEHKEPLTSDAQIGIRPMGVSPTGDNPLQSCSTVTIQGPVNTLSCDWDYERSTRNLPEAMWGAPVLGGVKAEANLIDNCLVGVKNVRPKSRADLSGPSKFMMEEVLTYTSIGRQDDQPGHPDRLPPSRAVQDPEQGFSTPVDWQSCIEETFAKPEKWASVLEALAGLGRDDLTNGDLKIPAADPIGQV